MLSEAATNYLPIKQEVLKKYHSFYSLCRDKTCVCVYDEHPLASRDTILQDIDSSYQNVLLIGIFNKSLNVRHTLAI